MATVLGYAVVWEVLEGKYLGGRVRDYFQYTLQVE